MRELVDSTPSEVLALRGPNDFDNAKKRLNEIRFRFIRARLSRGIKLK